MKSTKLLAVETSCDETAVALVEFKFGQFNVLENMIASQIKTHAPFGGVVPDLAARDHLRNLPVMLEKLTAKNKRLESATDLICVTQGPGLIPALLIGVNSAKALAYAWKKPLVGVNHIESHIYANFIGKRRKGSERISFPALILIVSGGHTELIFMKKHRDFRVVGQTLDDAAGEAFDKAAKILRLGYPGGPEIAKLAERNAKRNSFELPRPMLESPNLNFSFSGLKTALLYTVRDNTGIIRNKKLKAAISAEFQQAIIDVLIRKTVKAAKIYRPKTILLGGGVSANKELRKQMRESIRKNLKNTLCIIPDTQYSLDNAAMVAVSGYFQWKLSKNRNKFFENWKTLEAQANLKL